MIFPKNNHFKVTMYANSTVGLWPFIFEDHPLLQRLYRLYAKIALTIFTIFLTSIYIQVYVLIQGDDVVVQEVFGNLCVTLLYSTILTKTFVIRTPKMVGLIKEVLEVEKAIYESDDEEVVKIYDAYVARTHRTSIIFVFNCCMVASSYYIMPLLSPATEFDEATNATIFVRPIPISSWVPWEGQKYYWTTYWWQLFAGGVSSSNVMFMDIFMFSLIIFPLGQMEVLAYSLRNFQKYSLKLQSQLGCGREEASFSVFRQYALKHKDIIRYISDYNDGVRYVMVFDFLVSSIQLAAIAIQLVGAELDLPDLILWGSFVLCMLVRLFVYYWFANEIMLKSWDVSKAIWDCQWYDEPQKVKQLMLIMITRSQRALCLDIGPFSTMTLESFLVIVKGAYSYVTVMYR